MHDRPLAGRGAVPINAGPSAARDGARIQRLAIPTGADAPGHQETMIGWDGAGLHSSDSLQVAQLLGAAAELVLEFRMSDRD
jgi:hypothetical protein